MLSADQIKTLLLIVLALPFAVGLFLFLFQPGGNSSRRLASVFSLFHIFLTALLAYEVAPVLSDRAAAKPTDMAIFVPEFVPGSTSTAPHETTWTIMSLVPLHSVERHNSGVQFFIGLDGLNLWLVLLTSVMTFPITLISWSTIKERHANYFAWLFVLQGLILGVFLSFDILLFYVFFELTLVPLFFLIASWGSGPNRREAARKLFLFTLAGGLFTLLGIIGIVSFFFSAPEGSGVVPHLTFSIPELAHEMRTLMQNADPASIDKWSHLQLYLFLALMLGFAVKVPLIPFHSWLPGAYSEAPIGVTMMLSALAAKMGTFGILRICVPLAPDATLSLGLPTFGILAAIGIIYGAFCAYAQTDLKRLIAYSSVSHLGFCVLGILAFNPEGLAGGTLHMVNHGLSTGAMFLLAGFLMQRYGTGQIAEYSGIWAKLPVLTFFMIMICLASVGLPGLNNFVSEMLMLASLFDLKTNTFTGIGLAVASAAGIFFGAWYTITMIKKVFFGPLQEPNNQVIAAPTDLNAREHLAIVPVAILCVVLGLLPQPLLNSMRTDVQRLEQLGKEARIRVNSATPTLILVDK
jgi:NADH-quinone oxidoreductase subunit M